MYALHERGESQSEAEQGKDPGAALTPNHPPLFLTKFDFQY